MPVPGHVFQSSRRETVRPTTDRSAGNPIQCSCQQQQQLRLAGQGLSQDKHGVHLMIWSFCRKLINPHSPNLFLVSILGITNKYCLIVSFTTCCRPTDPTTTDRSDSVTSLRPQLLRLQEDARAIRPCIMTDVYCCDDARIIVSISLSRESVAGPVRVRTRCPMMYLSEYGHCGISRNATRIIFIKCHSTDTDDTHTDDHHLLQPPPWPSTGKTKTKSCSSTGDYRRHHTARRRTVADNKLANS